jgi:hypothetical protein
MPTPAQELLLQAALFRDARGAAAWEAWKSQVDLVQDRIDGGAYRLLPLVYLNLKALGVVDEHTSRLKGIHRKAWYENQMHLHTLSQVLTMFAGAGIPTLVLKGAPLALLHYPDVGARPMSDVDVLVPTEQVETAMNVLCNNDWINFEHNKFNQLTPAVIAIRHSWGYANLAGQGIDLHWHALHTGCFPGADDEFWQGAYRIEINNQETHALNATDMLFHVCVHGSRWSLMPPLRWVSDAWMIMRTAQDELDWERLIRLAYKFHATLQLRDMLAYLVCIFGIMVPAGVIDALSRANVSRIDQQVYMQFASESGGFARKAERHWHKYRLYKALWRENAHANPPVSMIDYIKVVAGINNVLDLFPRMLNKNQQKQA